MQIGIGLDASLGLSLDQQRDLAQQAVRLGYSSAWTPAGLAHDPFILCALWSQAAAQLSTGISVVPVANYSAPVLAMQAATVGDVSKGRFMLGIGAGSAFYAGSQQSLGMDTYPPIALMRDYLITLRALLAGEQVDYEGTVVKLHGVRLGIKAPRVPLYLGALGPQMLRLAGSHADGAALNWCTPGQIAWSRERIAEGARRAGRDPSAVMVAEYIRICVDDDVDVARRAYARAMLGYALVRPGTSKDLGYRAHFTRMGFDEALNDLEARREHGTSQSELIERFPSELLLKVGYFGPPAGAAAAFKRLAQGLDIAIVRVVAARPGPDAVQAVMRACAPASES